MSMKQKTRSAWLPGAGLIRGAHKRCTPSGLLHGLGNAVRHIPGPFVEQRVVLHYQEEAVVLLQDDLELDGGEGPSGILGGGEGGARYDASARAALKSQVSWNSLLNPGTATSSGLVVSVSILVFVELALEHENLGEYSLLAVRFQSLFSWNSLLN